MNAAKLKQAIIKEVSRSPGKTLVLVALLPVAAYFCFPLFKRFLPTRSAEGAATSTVAESTPSFLLAAATAPVTVEQTLPDWRQVLNWRASDQLTAPTPFALADRSPFQVPQPPTPEPATTEMEEEDGSTVDDSEQVDHVTAVASLRNLDLKLTATMVSGSVRLATINGRTLNEGQAFHAQGQADESAQQFAWEVVVVKIERRTVLLRHGDETIALNLPPDVPDNAVMVQTAGR